MKQSVLRTLSEKDYVLWLETQKDKLAPLDEDALIDLHSRVRRARNKHVTNYRRGAAGRVTKTGTRGGARPGNQKARDRAEALEVALSRVSRRLAIVSRESADLLRDERLAAARAGSRGHTAKSTSKQPAAPADRLDDRRLTKTPIRQKRVATEAAAGNRRQARKDNRGKR